MRHLLLTSALGLKAHRGSGNRGSTGVTDAKSCVVPALVGPLALDLVGMGARVVIANLLFPNWEMVNSEALTKYGRYDGNVSGR